LENVESVPFVPEDDFEDSIPDINKTPDPIDPDLLESMIESDEWNKTPLPEDRHIDDMHLPDVMRLLQENNASEPVQESGIRRNKRVYQKVLWRNAYWSEKARWGGITNEIADVYAISCQPKSVYSRHHHEIRDHSASFKDCITQRCLMYIYYSTSSPERPAALLSHKCTVPNIIRCAECDGEDECAATIGTTANSQYCYLLPEKYGPTEIATCYQQTATVARRSFVVKRGCNARDAIDIKDRISLHEYDAALSTGHTCKSHDSVGYLKTCHCMDEYCNLQEPSHLKRNNAKPINSADETLQQLRLDIKRMLGVFANEL